MEAVDRDYWNKCIDKVMKEAEQYLIYDGIIAPPCDTSSTENDGIPNSNVSEFVTISSVSNAQSTKKGTKKQLKPVVKKKRRVIQGGLEFRNLVVKQCTKELISPTRLASMHGISIRTIQKWVTRSGAKLPHKYKKQLLNVTIPINYQPAHSDSVLCTTFGDHSYTKTDFNLSAKKNLTSETPSVSTAAQNIKLDHSATKILKCPMCNFQTSRKNCLDSHIKSHATCKHCGQVFLGNRQMAVHLTTHKEKKNYLCDFCNMDCKKCSNKKRHMKICKKRPE